MAKQSNNLRVPRAICLAVALLLASPANASNFTVHVGPPSLGTGGNNPLSIPPTSFQEYEFVYITEKDSEITFGISPGIFYGVRNETSDGLYVSMGGGLAINANGVGPGVYSAIGINLGKSSIKFNAEYKQAIGFAGSDMFFPNAIRVGLAYEF